MPQDILFRSDDFVFSYRTGGILVLNGRILLQKPKDDDYAIVGGHVCRMETSEVALKREYREELHAEVETDRLIAVGELFFPWGEKTCHQICLYYSLRLSDASIPLEGSFFGYDDLGHRRLDLEYRWVPLEELKKGLKVYPLELIPILLTPSNETIHFVSRET